MTLDYSTLGLNTAKEISSGGEGKILELPSDKSKVAKIYHTPRPKSFEKHLQSLSALPAEFVAPLDIIKKGSEIAGFTMHYVDFNDYFIFGKLFNKGFCTANSITQTFKVEVLQKLKASVEAIHKQGIVIGDLNQYNIFVRLDKSEILFVDVDSFQTPTTPHSGVLMDDIRDWTTLEINASTDSFSYSVLAFWVMSFMHPYKWIHSSNSEGIQERVLNKHSILYALDKINGFVTPKIYESPVGDTLAQFKEIFDGRRYMVDVGGAHIATNVVIKKTFVSSALNIRELFSNVQVLHNATTNISIKSGDEWKLIRTNQKAQIFIQSTESDEIFPSNGAPVIRIQDEEDYLVSRLSNKVINFVKPQFYFHNGKLIVVDYVKDLMYYFDLDKQLGGSIHTIMTPVFAKSIMFNVGETPIQNFGAKRVALVPNNFGIVQKITGAGTKSAYVSGDFIMSESVIGKNVFYDLSGMTMDYFAYFAAQGNYVFVPDDGIIHVYNAGNKVMQLDAPMCTRTSKLYSTISGIMLLESGVLYLLNTK